MTLQRLYFDLQFILFWARSHLRPEPSWLASDRQKPWACELYHLAVSMLKTIGYFTFYLRFPLLLRTPKPWRRCAAGLCCQRTVVCHQSPCCSVVPPSQLRRLCLLAAVAWQLDDLFLNLLNHFNHFNFYRFLCPLPLII